MACSFLLETAWHKGPFVANEQLTCKEYLCFFRTKQHIYLSAFLHFYILAKQSRKGCKKCLCAVSIHTLPVCMESHISQMGASSRENASMEHCNNGKDRTSLQNNVKPKKRLTVPLRSTRIQSPRREHLPWMCFNNFGLIIQSKALICFNGHF